MENMHNLIALLQNKQLKYDDLMLGFDLILYHNNIFYCKMQACSHCKNVPKLILPEVFFRICAETIVGAKKEEKHEEKIIAIDPVIGHGGIHACGLWAEQRHRGQRLR